MQFVHTNVEDKIGAITIHNPDGGFMTAPMVRELDEVTLAWKHDRGIRAIIITGKNPGTFITHYSVDELSQLSDIVPAKSIPASRRWRLRPHCWKGMRRREKFPSCKKA